MKRITVLLADDHAVVRAGLRALLEAEDDIEVVGEAHNGREAVQMTKKLGPAVVVMDIAMPLLNGLEATRQILEAIPTARIVILSAYGDEEYVEKAIGLGAAGYLIKQTSALVLSKAIRRSQQGEDHRSPPKCSGGRGSRKSLKTDSPETSRGSHPQVRNRLNRVCYR